MANPEESRAGEVRNRKARFFGESPALTFPKNTLEESFRLVKPIEQASADGTMLVRELAAAVGYLSAQHDRFQDLLRSADQYGFVADVDPGTHVKIAELGRQILAAHHLQRAQGLWQAFRNVQAFAVVETLFGGRDIPLDESLVREVEGRFELSRDWAEVFAKVFHENLAFLRSCSSAAPVHEERAMGDSVLQVPPDKPLISRLPRDVRGRECVEKCFVIMPFADKFHQRYERVYHPAIEESGLTPVRGDGLFSSVGVMEQVWEQIKSATLVLADLSGKNPNVFYELGLAHAAKKPVVLTAALIDDVPFDLQHIQVIVYDQDDPYWGDSLKKNVVARLKNAIADPAKSIPHPFRGEVQRTKPTPRKHSRRPSLDETKVWGPANSTPKEPAAT